MAKKGHWLSEYGCGENSSGKWGKIQTRINGHIIYQCSECGIYMTSMRDDESGDWEYRVVIDKNTSRCPFCGIQMEVEHE